MSASTSLSNPSSSHWNHEQSNWKRSVQTPFDLIEKMRDPIQTGLKTIGELLTVAFMIVCNALFGATLLIAVPVLAVMALSAFVIAISGSIVLFGSVLTFLGVIQSV